MFLKRCTLLMAFMLFVFVTYPALGMKVELVKEKLVFSPQTEKPISLWDFCVTDDGLFIIPDFGAGNLKIYEKNGNYLELIQTVGKKGYYPDEFVKPTVCNYSREENRLVVMDVGIRKIFIYNRMGRSDFERDKMEIPCWRGAYDLQLKNDRLFVSGYADDPNNAENGYEFYSVDLKDGLKTQYLLSTPEKYNVTLKDYNENFGDSIVPYGIQGWFDLKDDIAYFIWEGNSKRIIKIDTLAGFQSAFDPKTSDESGAPRSFSSADKLKLQELEKKGDFRQVEKLRVQITPLVRNLFITKQNNILTIVEGSFLSAGTTSFMAQIFTDSVLKGTIFISALQPDSKVFYDKTEGCLWAISGDNIQKFQIIE